ncbi:MAG: hypothetical protein WBC44_07185, partial [Planctomycetaceae bacterium]
LRTIADNADGRPVGVRVELTGSCAACDKVLRDPDRWKAEIISVANAELSGIIWIQKVTFGLSVPKESEEWSEGVAAELRQILTGDAGRNDDAWLEELKAELGDMRKKLPRDFGARLDDPDWLRTVADEAGQWLNARLFDS